MFKKYSGVKSVKMFLKLLNVYVISICKLIMYEGQFFKVCLIIYRY